MFVDVQALLRELFFSEQMFKSASGIRHHHVFRDNRSRITISVLSTLACTCYHDIYIEAEQGNLFSDQRQWRSSSLSGEVRAEKVVDGFVDPCILLSARLRRICDVLYIMR